MKEGPFSRWTIKLKPEVVGPRHGKNAPFIFDAVKKGNWYWDGEKVIVYKEMRHNDGN